ncbi:hypothetical protein FACS189440_19570 [Bacteroidia bacterium]|nr:hypothetical protein FACS189440_19570 [Bacteroidia bacterium]
MKRVTVYIDGFNFYYGLKRKKIIDSDWKKFYWIDFVKLFEQFLGQDQILQRVVYFTATPLSSSKSSRQGALLNANKIINKDKFEIIRGKYFAKQITCPYCNASIDKPEEKRTDVNISVQIIGDCALNKTDVVILVSADSDLVPPLEFIQQNFPDKKVKVYFPPTGHSGDLNNNIVQNKGKVVKLEYNKSKFFNSIMSDTVTNGTKTSTIPDKWKN